jgi:hypothetical protein
MTYCRRDPQAKGIRAHFGDPGDKSQALQSPGSSAFAADGREREIAANPIFIK